MSNLWFKSVSTQLTRYGSFNRFTILQENAKSKTIWEAGASWKGSFLDNIASQYILQGEGGGGGSVVANSAAPDFILIRIGSVFAFRPGHYIY